MNKLSWKAALYMGIGAVTILLNVIAWNSAAFCDWYIKYVFPAWVNTYGRLTGLFPFSVGEILLAAGVVLVLLSCVLWIPLAWRKFVFLRQKCVSPRKGGVSREEKSALLGKKRGFQRERFVPHGEKSISLKKKEAVCDRAASFCTGIRRFYLFFAWTFVIVCLIMTLNCFILYHASTFSQNYFQEEQGREYGLEELLAVRNLVVEECNRLSGEMVRDGDGSILYGKNIGKEAIACMRSLGKTYDQLDGYYPRPKPMAASDFFSQQYMCGYYFPFSMEANYNDVMYIMNKPASICHELAHLRGYIFEDEANFISFLACVESEDPVFVYSGYLSVLNYLDNDFYRAVGRDREAYMAQVRILPQVTEDDVFVTEKEWERINGKALIDTQVVDAVSDAMVDATLKVNGVQDGIISYNRVVTLLLQYYDRQGYFS